MPPVLVGQVQLWGQHFVEPEEWETTTASFVIRLRRRSGATVENEATEPPWLGRIEHAQTGQRATLRNLREVVPFILRCLKDGAPFLSLLWVAALQLTYVVNL